MSKVHVCPNVSPKSQRLWSRVSNQEYTEEFRDIAKGKSKESLPTGPITLLNQRPVSEDVCPKTHHGTYISL